MVDKSTLNATFLQLLQDPTMNDNVKTAELQKVANGIVKTFVEQEGFAGRILPPQPLTREQCIPDGIEGNLFVLRPIDDFRVRSIEVSRTGNPTGRLISAKDYKIWMTYRESDVVEKDLRQIQDTYTIDFQEIFESRIGLSLQRRQDIKFMQSIWAGLGYNYSTGALTSGTGTKQILDMRDYWGTTGKSRGLTSEMFTRVVQAFGSKSNPTGAASTDIEVINNNFISSDKPLVAFTLLMNIYDFADLGEMPASEIGDWLKAEFFHQYNMPSIKGINIVTTIHQDIIPRGKMYFFSSPDYMGHSFEVDPIQVLTKIDTFNSEFKMKGRCFAGHGIGNASSFWELLWTPRGQANPGSVTQPTCPVLD